MIAPLLAFDIETQKTFEEIHGGAIADLKLAVACTLDLETGKTVAYREADAAALGDALRAARLVVGFNHLRFDFKVLEGYGLSFQGCNSFDIMADLEQRIGRRVSLESVARETLGRGKTGDGLAAVSLYKAGEWDRLIEYCHADVRLTADVMLHGMRSGSVRYKEKGTGIVRSVLTPWRLVPAVARAWQPGLL